MQLKWFVTFLIGVSGSLIAAVSAKTRESGLVDPAHASFTRKYLLGYLVSAAADWMQGAYVYALYSSYGYTKHENAMLFVAGFGASAIFGVFAGLMADRLGRRFACVLYCVLYMLSCITKHFNEFHVLMLGRLFGGAATSLLFSAFDSWLVSENQRLKFGSNQLSNTFSTAVYYNSIVAVACGLLGEFSVAMYSPTVITWIPNFHVGGYLVPFDISFLFCVLAAALMLRTWGENYGEADVSLGESWIASVKLLADPSILCVGVVSALFEASMFIFVFNWTPAILIFEEDPPYGMIFALFMIACMLGSKICKHLRRSMSAQKVATVALTVAAVSHAALLYEVSVQVYLLAFMLFEVSVGMYFPSVGTLKAEIVPEAHRATIYNLFRIPLNAIVILSLCFQFSVVASFIITTTSLTAGAVLLFCVRMDQVNEVLPALDSETAVIIGNTDEE